jgi:ABC-type sugar transport system ATPase subunit
MIEVHDLYITLPGFALQGLSFQVVDSAYCMLMGATGAGKTTLLEALCGLRPVQRGRIVVAGRDITHAAPGERGIGYVPQDGALFPTMTVREQMQFPLRLRTWTGKQMELRIAELAELLGIEGLLGRLPRGLSGGERQRVALGRALACRPPVLCLDEPLSALDGPTRLRLQGLLKQVQQRERTTVLHVSHSEDESRALGTQVLRLEDGRIQPAGEP